MVCKVPFRGKHGGTMVCKVPFGGKHGGTMFCKVPFGGKHGGTMVCHLLQVLKVSGSNFHKDKKLLN